MDSRYPAALEELMELLRSLPGVGRRSAERMAMQFFSWDQTKLSALGELLTNLKERVRSCAVCGNLADGEDPDCRCAICASPTRDPSVICVVEEATQIRNVEASGVFRGLYHVLGGRIAPLEGKGIETLRITELEERLNTGTVKELILALSPDVEGQATAVYLAERLKDRGLSISRLAQGLPAGSDLNYADPATIAAAVSGRTSFGKNEQ